MEIIGALAPTTSVGIGYETTLEERSFGNVKRAADVAEATLL